MHFLTQLAQGDRLYLDTFAEKGADMRMQGHRLGYIRTSTLDQSEARQLEGIALDKVFRDFASGKDTKRPELG